MAALPSLAAAQAVFINEIHYDNTGGDLDEGVEVAGPSGTDLSAYTLTFFNGSNGSKLNDVALGGVIPEQSGTGFGTLNFPIEGIQNGAPDGVVLRRGATIVEFLSWEGTFTAMEAPAAGLDSTGIPFSESSPPPVGYSLQKVGSGNDGSEFSWAAPMPATRGAVNTGQTFLATGPPRVALATTPICIGEGGVATGTLTLVPPPAGPVTIGLAAMPEGEISLPATVVVGATGVADFTIAGTADGLADGDRRVTVAAVDGGGGYEPAIAELFVTDADGGDFRGSSIRVMTYNIEQGIGPVGGAQFLGAQATIRRVDPDVICFQELEDDGAFADLRALLTSLGYATDPRYLATQDDRFGSFVGGDFSGFQWVAVASRFPITEVRQIGRDDSFVELSRYPLFVAVDVPGVPAAADPSFVSVHSKAGSSEADFFRKAVEGFRMTAFLSARGLDGNSSNLFVMGDFNADLRFSPGARSYTTADKIGGFRFPDNSTLPASFSAGTDLPATLTYDRFPRDTFAPLGLSDLPARQVDGNPDTRATVDARPLDYILAPALGIANGNTPSEIYNSLLEPLSTGLPKSCEPIGPELSRQGSDHLPVFADIELEPRPTLSVAVLGGGFYEDAGAGVAMATVTLSRAPTSPLSVRLSARPAGRITLDPSTVTLLAGERQKSVLIGAVADGVPMPDTDVVVAATAPGYSTGYDTVMARNLEAEGAALISQYIDTNSGSSPKGIEVINNTNAVIDFGKTPLTVRRFTNGSPSFTTVAYLFDGALAAGEVVVVGDVSIGQYLKGQGIVLDPENEIASGNNGFSFYKPDGDVGFVQASPGHSGDDALEVTLGFVRADVFGMIGNDPGSAWTGGNPLVTTDGTMLERQRFSTRGSAGWSDPSLRFFSGGSGTNLAGFGVAPVIANPFDTVVASLGLSGAEALPGADPDWDTVASAVEFFQGTGPNDPGSSAPIVPLVVSDGSQDYLALQFRRRTDQAGLAARIQFSSDGFGDWQTDETVQVGAAVANGDGSETVTLRSTRAISGVGSRFLRLLIELL